MSRWRTYYRKFINLGRFGDSITLAQLPEVLATKKLAEAFGSKSSVSIDSGVVVCGSHGETANNLLLGGDAFRSAFDSYTRYNVTGSNSEFRQMKRTIWTTIALKAQDQLRQRVAWALSQVLVISPGSIEARDFTEVWVNYYDIFVRNAFGNYGDILKEVSYSPMMAEMLTYLESKSTSYVLESASLLQYPDENYAREIMQLFTVGLYKLNLDGTHVLKDGEPIPTYDNKDIEEYARVWTGFYQQGLRGNIERGHRNRLDPMRVDHRR